MLMVKQKQMDSEKDLLKVKQMVKQMLMDSEKVKNLVKQMD
jgi:hypothetical protein